MKLTTKSVISVVVAFAGIFFVLIWFCGEVFRAVLPDGGMWMLWQEYLWDIAAMAIGSFFLVGFAVAAVMYRFVVRPLGKLSLALRKMSEGNLDEEIRYSSSDEIGELAVSLEKMRLVLKTSISQTIRSRDEALQSEMRAKKQIKDIERLNELMVDRELRMVELKKRIEECEVRDGRRE